MQRDICLRHIGLPGQARRAWPRTALGLGVAAGLVGSPRCVDACERAAPWSRLGAAASETTTPTSLVLFAGALAMPAAMAPTGADHALRLFSQRDLGGKPNAEPVSIWTPFVAPFLLAGIDSIAYATGSCEVMRPTSAMLQAMAWSLVTVTSLKWVTGRSWPNAGRDPSLPDRLDHPEFAHDFHWFSWRQGSAWPSGHTATMVAAATALTTVTYGRSWWAYVALAGATGVAAGMWLGDHHWGSDILSGALIGAASGRAVGLAFRDPPSTSPGSTPLITPWQGQRITGLKLTILW